MPPWIRHMTRAVDRFVRWFTDASPQRLTDGVDSSGVPEDPPRGPRPGARDGRPSRDPTTLDPRGGAAAPSRRR